MIKEFFEFKDVFKPAMEESMKNFETIKVDGKSYYTEAAMSDVMERLVAMGILMKLLKRHSNYEPLRETLDCLIKINEDGICDEDIDMLLDRKSPNE